MLSKGKYAAGKKRNILDCNKGVNYWKSFLRTYGKLQMGRAKPSPSENGILTVPNTEKNGTKYWNVSLRTYGKLQMEVRWQEFQ